MSNKVKVPGGAFYAGDGLTVDPVTRTVSAGGGDVTTPDWNQNDATASDYIKNRPFYTETVETVLVEESTVSFAADDSGLYMTYFESTFSATVGETYKVSWDGITYECAGIDYRGNIVIGNLSIIGAGSDTGEPFFMLVNNGKGIGIATADASASHTISISGFAQEVVKIDEKYLPDTVATKSEVEATQTTANSAQRTANSAQRTADTAKTTADTAKTTANAAKTTAENAQTTANAALERAVEPYTRNMLMAPLYKNGGFSAWRKVVQGISYDKTEGYFFVNEFDTTALKGEDMPYENFCARVYVGNERAMAFLSKSATVDNRWSVTGFAVITDDYSRKGEVLYVSSNTISQNEAKGLFLTFRAPDSMLLKSSTNGSDKQFRITVDDSGTIRATEVTA